MDDSLQKPIHCFGRFLTTYLIPRLYNCIDTISQICGLVVSGIQWCIDHEIHIKNFFMVSHMHKQPGIFTVIVGNSGYILFNPPADAYCKCKHIGIILIKRASIDLCLCANIRNRDFTNTLRLNLRKKCRFREKLPEKQEKLPIIWAQMLQFMSSWILQ